ncbi:MAG: oligopeptide/dipeptide ABC transporter ATP-binding protein [Candidatus Limnocylindrales bacterium]
MPADVGVVEGCAFAPRCPIAVDRCGTEQPPVRELGPAHFVACHLAGRGEIP